MRGDGDACVDAVNLTVEILVLRIDRDVNAEIVPHLLMSGENIGR